MRIYARSFTPTSKPTRAPGTLTFAMRSLCRLRVALFVAALVVDTAGLMWRQPTDSNVSGVEDIDSTAATNSAVQESALVRSCRSPHRLELENDNDVSYVGIVTVGYQDLKVILDTGSYEFVLFSDRCLGCGQTDSFYHDAQSASFHQGELQAKQNYGSGYTHSQEAYDDVRVGCLTVEQQFFWQVTSAVMPVVRTGSFQGIFGLGPPRSNIQMAENEMQEAATTVRELEANGVDVSRYRPLVHNLEDVHEFALSEKLWLTNLGMHSFSVCLRQGEGKSGFFIYNDDRMEQHPGFFQRVRNVGKLYWSTEMTNVRLGDTDIDCIGGEVCTVVMDTGTSLIAAPSRVVRQVERLISSVSTGSHNCEDLSIFPRLDFVLDGQPFTLPPEAYVGVLEGEAPDWVLELIPSLRSTQDLRRSMADVGSNFTYCSPLLMDTGDQREGEWIFGLPFFRRYYTTFRLDEESLSAESMYMAPANDACEVGEPSELRVPAGSLRARPLHINVAKLRPPRPWANRHREKYGFDF